MDRRLKLQTLLKSLMAGPNTGDPPRGKVYFQPETNINIEYPCILYQLDQDRKEFANNKPYARTKRYQVTVIDKDPDSDIPDKVAALPMSTFQRHFSSAGLYHTIYSLYF